VTRLLLERWPPKAALEGSRRDEFVAAVFNAQIRRMTKSMIRLRNGVNGWKCPYFREHACGPIDTKRAPDDITQQTFSRAAMTFIAAVFKPQIRRMTK